MAGNMRSRVAMLAVLLLAGCAEKSDGTNEGAAAEPTIRLRDTDQAVAGTDPLYYLGPEMSWGDVDTLVFDVDIPDGYWSTHVGTFGVVISWDMRENAWFNSNMTTPDGSVAPFSDGFFASVLVIPSPASEPYVVQVRPQWGLATYRLEAQVDAAAIETAPRDLLPNLVTLPPTDLWVGGSRSCTPVVNQCVGERVCTTMGCAQPLRMAGIRACSALEVAEEGAQRCLRFSNRIGNAGEGPFKVVLKDQADQALAFAGLANWVQHIYQTDGSVRLAEVGPAAYHPTHGHVHYQGMADYQLFGYDLERSERLEPVAEGRKVGFCLVDYGVVAWDMPRTAPPASLVPSCGLGSNWWDLYSYELDGQYIEITGVPDGVYELVSTANSLGTAIESNLYDNEASVVFRLNGDDAEVLESIAEYRGTGQTQFPPVS